MENGIIVMSLFNGMSTGHKALDNLGIKVKTYYSSEIKPFAIELTQYHYPETIQLGDVTKWRDWSIDWSKVDLVLSGSPCQDLSIAGNRKGIDGNRSGLFWTFIEMLEHIKKLNPNVIFFQENVGSATRKDIGIMSRAMGVYPVRINSKLVTAQLRDRYYWTNAKTRQDGFFGDVVTDIPQPKDRKIMFKDIIENGFTDRKKSTAVIERYYSDMYKDEESEKAQRYIRSRDAIGMCPIVHVLRESKEFVERDKSQCIGEKYNHNFQKDEESEKGQKYLKKRTENFGGVPVVHVEHKVDIFSVDKEKANCILESESRPHKQKDKLLKRNKKGFTNIVYIENDEVRVKTNNVKGYEVMTENDCLNLAFPTSETRRGRVTKGKSACLTKVVEPLFSLKDYTVRTLTKIELCRLQGFPDYYCDILSRNHSASLLGDGWTLPIIEHIFQYLPFEKSKTI